jgi:glycosyltransferase involved in cell wall biosynthesis
MSEGNRARRPQPEITIITIVKNNKCGLEKTVGSLFDQSFMNWELIILVGKSTDGTLELASSFTDMDGRVRHIEQIGDGIYPAMNQALDHAGGEYAWFMNAGDTFAHFDSIMSAIKVINEVSCNVLIGGYQVFEKGIFRTYSKKKGFWHSLGISLNRRGLCHQSTVMKTNLIKELSGFDLGYKVAADFDLILRSSAANRIYRTDIPLSHIESGGISSLQLSDVLKEKQDIRKSYFGRYSINYYLGYFWTLTVNCKVRLREAMSLRCLKLGSRDV